jgi:hypothetical protein
MALAGQAALYPLNWNRFYDNSFARNQTVLQGQTSQPPCAPAKTPVSVCVPGMSAGTGHVLVSDI